MVFDVNSSYSKSHVCKKHFIINMNFFCQISFSAQYVLDYIKYIGAPFELEKNYFLGDFLYTL